MRKSQKLLTACLCVVMVLSLFAACGGGGGSSGGAGNSKNIDASAVSFPLS